MNWTPPTVEEAVAFTVDWLARRILAAKAAYYAGAPIMSDTEFDSLEKTLRAYAPNHSALQQVGARREATNGSAA